MGKGVSRSGVDCVSPLVFFRRGCKSSTRPWVSTQHGESMPTLVGPSRSRSRSLMRALVLLTFGHFGEALTQSCVCFSSSGTACRLNRLFAETVKKRLIPTQNRGHRGGTTILNLRLYLNGDEKLSWVRSPFGVKESERGRSVYFRIKNCIHEDCGGITLRTKEAPGRRSFFGLNTQGPAGTDLFWLSLFSFSM